MELVEVKNEGYITRGYKVNRRLLEDILIEPRDIELVYKKRGEND